MNDRTDHTVGDLLERSARDLPPVDLVDGALDLAQRTRQRRRAIAGVGVAVAALAVAISVTVLPRQGDVQPTRHTPKPKIFQAPALRADIIQPALDPSRIASLPQAHTELPGVRVPTRSSTRPPGRAVMVTKQRKGPQQNLFALDADMHWHMVQLDAPADIGNGLGPMLDADALSPDGTRVALRGAKHMYVVDLATDDMSTMALAPGDTARWTGDHTLEVADSHSQRTSVGDTVIRVRSGGYTERKDGALVIRAKVRPRDSYDATDPRATSDRVAVSAAPSFTGKKHAPAAGILVLDRPSYRGEAFLPVTSLPGQGSVRPRVWLDDDTLLFSVYPAVNHGGTVTMPREYYLTWNVETGEVARVGSVSQFWRDSSWAGQLLQR